MSKNVIIAARFCGPDGSGNGGYTGGLLAAELTGACEVTLKRPPPLDTPLSLQGKGALALMHGADVVAEAREVTLELEVPAPPTFAEADACSRRYVGFTHHAFPRCFVCGPARAEDDGLRIFAGPDAAGTRVAAPWLPGASLADESGLVTIPLVWAALDCPGYFAAADGRPALLGRMTAEVHRRPRSGERHVIVGWSLGNEGRKLHAGTALYDEHGVLCARARQTWIIPA